MDHAQFCDQGGNGNDDGFLPQPDLDENADDGCVRKIFSVGSVPNFENITEATIKG